MTGTDAIYGPPERPNSLGFTFEKAAGLCPIPILGWSRRYRPGDLFDAAGYQGCWVGWIKIRWIGRDGRFYCDLFLDHNQPETRTGTAVLTRLEIEQFDLCGGPTCRAEQAEIDRRRERAQ